MYKSAHGMYTWTRRLAFGSAWAACLSSCARDWNDVNYDIDEEDAGFSSADFGSGSQSDAATAGETSGGNSGSEVREANSSAAFPATDILDDFNRSGELDTPWFGPRITDYSIQLKRVRCAPCVYLSPLLWKERFGANQEVHARIATFEARSAEIALILLSQGRGCDEIQVLYSPATEQLKVDVCQGSPGNDPPYWTLWHTPYVLNMGDRLGARVLPGNQIEVWVNHELIGTADASSYAPTSGYIGIVAHDNTDMPVIAWDDFGGGEY